MARMQISCLFILVCCLYVIQATNEESSEVDKRFLRFGKRNQGDLSEAASKREYVRFGRSSPVSKREYIRFGRSAGAPAAKRQYIRFGKRSSDGPIGSIGEDFIRFGRYLEDINGNGEEDASEVQKRYLRFGRR